MNDDTGELLRLYSQNGCEEAFRELVERHVGLVYATALRKMSGDTAAAEDVSQRVFSDLARKARSLPVNVLLPGWLYRHTCLKSIEAIRAESRRRTREQIAAEMNALHHSEDAVWREVAPELDEAMHRLDAPDRDALVLRFFQNSSLRAIGEVFGVSEDAAQKRIARALERLRAQLSRQGVTCTGAALCGALSVHATPIAPAGMAASVCGAALATTAASQAGVSLLEAISLMSKAKTIIAGALILGAATTIVLQQRANSRLREQLAATGTALAAAESAAPDAAGANSRDAAIPPAATASQPRRSVREIMGQAIGLTSRPGSRQDIVKEIEPLLAQIPVSQLKEGADMALGITDRNWRMGFLHMLLRRWAAADGATALNYLTENVKGDFQLPLLAGALPAWAERDPDGAWTWFQTTGQEKLQFDARGRQNAAIGEMFTTMGRVDFDRSVARALELEGIDMANAFQGLAQAGGGREQQLQLLASADRLEDPRDRENVRRSILNVWAGMQPGEARTYVENLSDPALRSQSARNVGPAILATDPEKGAEWWLSQTTEGDRPTAVKEIVQRWTEADLVGAAKWLPALGNSPEADIAKREFVTAAMMRAPDAAMAWANSISDSQKRLQSMRDVYRVWRGRSPVQAEQWLAGAGLSPEMTAEITKGRP